MRLVPSVPCSCSSAGCAAPLQGDFGAPSCWSPASWSSSVPWSPHWSVGPVVSAPGLPSPVSAVQMEPELGPPHQAWLWGGCGERLLTVGPAPPSLGRPVGLGFPLSHLRKESPSGGSEEEQ